MFLKHSPPAAADTAGRAARSSQGEYFTSRKEKQGTFLQNNITETKTFLDCWTVRKHHTKSQKKKSKIKIPTLASAFQNNICNNSELNSNLWIQFVPEHLKLNQHLKTVSIQDNLRPNQV